MIYLSTPFGDRVTSLLLLLLLLFGDSDGDEDGDEDDEFSKRPLTKNSMPPTNDKNAQHKD